MTNDRENAARQAHKRHMKYIHEINKEAWLDNMADDIVIQDPVGPTPLNPTGAPLNKAQMAELWDRSMKSAGDEVPPPQHQMHTFYCCGNEVACVGRTISMLPRKGDGKLVECVCEGIFIYGVNEQGKLNSVKAYFDFERVFNDIDFSLPVEQ